MSAPSDTTVPAAETPAAPAPATAEALAATNAHLADLIRTLREAPTQVPAAAPAPTPAARPARYTEAQLAAAVDRGEITQAIANAALRQYDREDMAAEIERQVAARTSAATAAERVSAKQNALIAAHPDLGRRGSDLWNDCARVYREMVEDGATPGAVTELAAAREVTATLRARTPAAEPEETTHTARPSERTAPATPATRRAPGTRDVWHGIPADMRSFYEKCLERGQWKGTSDPKFLQVLDGARERLATPGRRRA